MRLVVILTLLLILLSLGSALFYLVKDRGGSTRTIKALTWRIGLSMSLFLLLMGSHYLGLIPARGL